MKRIRPCLVCVQPQDAAVVNRLAHAAQKKPACFWRDATVLTTRPEFENKRKSALEQVSNAGAALFLA